VQIKDITNYLEKGQVEALLRAAVSCDTLDYLIMRVLWRTEVRVDELLHIRPRDIEYNTKVVNIVKTKGGRQRRVLLDPETLTLLNTCATADSIADDVPIFQLSQRWVRALIARYGRLVGSPSCTCFN